MTSPSRTEIETAWLGLLLLGKGSCERGQTVPLSSFLFACALLQVPPSLGRSKSSVSAALDLMVVSAATKFANPCVARICCTASEISLRGCFGSWGSRKIIKRCVPSSCDAKRITSLGVLVGTGGKEFQRLGISRVKFHSELL